MLINNYTCTSLMYMILIAIRVNYENDLFNIKIKYIGLFNRITLVNELYELSFMCTIFCGVKNLCIEHNTLLIGKLIQIFRERIVSETVIDTSTILSTEIWTHGKRNVYQIYHPCLKHVD